MKLLSLLAFSLALAACGPPFPKTTVTLVPGAASCAHGGYTVVIDDPVTGVTQQVICNGAPGATGAAGADGIDGADGIFSDVEVLDPCGNAPGIEDEVLLRLSDGRVLVSFSSNANGDNTRLALLGPGTYTTTDGSSCTFTLTSEGRLQ